MSYQELRNPYVLGHYTKHEVFVWNHTTVCGACRHNLESEPRWLTYVNILRDATMKNALLTFICHKGQPLERAM